MDLEYVSIAKSRDGYSPETPNPKTSATPAAKTTHDGGKSASKNEEG